MMGLWGPQTNIFYFVCVVPDVIYPFHASWGLNHLDFSSYRKIYPPNCPFFQLCTCRVLLGPNFLVLEFFKHLFSDSSFNFTLDSESLLPIFNFFEKLKTVKHCSIVAIVASPKSQTAASETGLNLGSHSLSSRNDLTKYSCFFHLEDCNQFLYFRLCYWISFLCLLCIILVSYII
jgi:hypothetical protein